MDTIYRIIDMRTGKQVGADYASRKRAQSQADRLDLRYGAVRYIVKPIFPTE